MTDERILIAAGATGGHIMPAVALARAIEAARPGARIVFVGTGRPAEARILSPYGWERHELVLRGIKGLGAAALPGAGWLALKALKKAVDIVRHLRPTLALATGGYVAGPVGLAVRLAGTPLVIHEQNSRPGLTNRALSIMADLILVAFPEAAERFPKKKTLVVGNPVREEIAALKGLKRDYAAGPLTLTILGGSQGSRALNLAGLELVRGLSDAGMSPRVIHQSGEAMEAEVRDGYRAMGIEAEVGAFFDDMVSVYRKSHLAVGRAGALTVFELAAAGLPAVLVPLPTAADDHQSLNARDLAKTGLARVVKESEIASGALLSEVKGLFENPARLEAASLSDVSALEVLAGPKAADLAEKMLKLARRS